MTWHEIHLLDQQITLWINSFHCGFSDFVMKTFSNIPVWIPMYLAVVVFLYWKLGWKKATVITLSIAVAFGMCDQFSNLIKAWVARPRPCRDEFMLAEGLRVLEGGGGKFGFFSAHAANAFSFAVTTIMGMKYVSRRNVSEIEEKGKEKEPSGYRIYYIWIVLWAIMVSISRIFVGKHYLGDVIVGTIVGLLFGYMCARIASIFIPREPLRRI